jgi:hypothetical protein
MVQLAITASLSRLDVWVHSMDFLPLTFFPLLIVDHLLSGLLIMEMDLAQ